MLTDYTPQLQDEDLGYGLGWLCGASLLVGVIVGDLELLRDAYPGDQRVAELAGEALGAALRCESYVSVAGFRPLPDVPSAARLPPGSRGQ